MNDVLRLPALEIRQGPTRLLYSFAIDGKQLDRIAAVSRVHRDETHRIEGYQRPEVLSHIKNIRNYVESSGAMLPNALVLAFDPRVRFEATKNDGDECVSRAGELVIPLVDLEGDVLPGWVVDGQQRIAAIRDARVKDFPVCVVAFITDSQAEQRSQFILVNHTKPLPSGLINELLPASDGLLPPALRRRQFPAVLMDRLNFDDDSPFVRRIKTPTTPEGIVKDNSILRMIENSFSDGALYSFRDPMSGTGDEEAMLKMLKSFWSAVRRVFADAWDKPPRQSRLMHGVGIVSLGFLMDAITDRQRSRVLTVDDYESDLLPLATACRWTNGFWPFGPDSQRRWNELQNTTKDVALLTNYLLMQYKSRVWNQVSAQDTTG